MIRPDDRPWYVPYEPESPVYQRLLDTIKRNDLLAQQIGMKRMIEQVTGTEFEVMMMASVHEAAVVATVCPPGMPPESVTLGAWLTGFSFGLRNVRKIDLPENPPQDAGDMLYLMFSDLDPESVTFLARERAAKIAEDGAFDRLNSISPVVGSLAAASSLWLDGLITGLTYDKEH